MAVSPRPLYLCQLDANLKVGKTATYPDYDEWSRS